MSACPITAYFHCRGCYEYGQQDKIAAGFDPQQNVIVWCETCDTEVVRFEVPHADR